MRTYVLSEARLTVKEVSTAMKGNAAEGALMNEFLGRGLTVLVPFGDGHPYDFVVHLPDNLFLRIQCKAARSREGCLLFNSRTTDHGRGRLPYFGRADAFGVYHQSTQTAYIVPILEFETFVVTLRVEPPKNNQRQGVRLASDYEFAKWSIQDFADMTNSQLHTKSTARVAV